MNEVRLKKPKLMKAEVFQLVDDLRDFIETTRAMSTWLDELPEPIFTYLNQMHSRGAAATTRRERLDALWCGDCWFFMDDDRDRRAARDWLMEEGDAWLRRDPRKRKLTYRDALTEARRLMRPAQPEGEQEENR